MNTLKLDEYFKNLDGEDITENDTLNIAKTLANILIGAEGKIDAAKGYDWAMKLWNDGFIELDNSDLETLKKFIQYEGIPLARLAIAQIERKIIACQNEMNKSK